MKTGAVIAAAGVPGGFSSYDTMENVDAADMIRRMIFQGHTGRSSIPK